jgi:hypothetical protein
MQPEQSQFFYQALKSRLSQQAGPHAVICIFGCALNSINEKPNMARKPIWHSELSKALAIATSAESHIIIKDDSHVAVVVSKSTLQRTNQLTRIIRSHLMRSHDLVRVSIAAAQIDDADADADADYILTEIYANLGLNIDQRSSRIDVKHFVA